MEDVRECSICDSCETIITCAMIQGAVKTQNVWTGPQKFCENTGYPAHKSIRFILLCYLTSMYPVEP